MSRATLLAAADLLERPGGWIQGNMAENRRGEPTAPRDADAVCFCTMGALTRVAEGTYGHDIRTIRAVLDPLGLANVATWNDAPERTQAEVVATVRRAAEMVG